MPYVVAQTQCYHLVCDWGSLVKLQGGGVVLKSDVFSHCYANFLCCLHASYEPLCRECSKLGTAKLMVQ